MNSTPREGNPDQIWDVVIVGGGPAGATAALYAARAGWSTVVVDKGIAAGALGMTSKITNYPGVGETLTGAQLVEKIRAQAIGFGASFVAQRITAATLSDDGKMLVTGEGSYRGRAVIVATGSMGRSQTIPGEQRLTGRGVSYCATCDGYFFADKDVMVVGNSDEALEEALHLARFARRVLIASPTPQLRADDTLVRQATEHERIEIRLGAQVREIIGENAVEGVVVEAGGIKERVPVSGAFIYLQGGKPILDFVGGQLATTGDGCLQVDDMFQTSVQGVFAAGDVLCKHVKQAVIAAAEGAQAAIASDRYLSGRPSLKPDWA
ncbi:FAD-dependent oxidoreductase [Candidatus Bipolaricaulota bacterium]|nr:FAD-dependent oxidoreductase [Candidatus Bipolaricaulota bacterium]